MLVYSGNTVFFLPQSRECMRKQFFSGHLHNHCHCSISSDFLLEIAFFHSFTTIIIQFILVRVFRQINSFLRRIAFSVRISSVIHSFKGHLPHIYSSLEYVCLTNQIHTYHNVRSLYPHYHTLYQH